MSMRSNTYEYFIPYFKANRAVFGRRFAYRYSMYLCQFIVVVNDNGDEDYATAGV